MLRRWFRRQFQTSDGDLKVFGVVGGFLVAVTVLVAALSFVGDVPIVVALVWIGTIGYVVGMRQAGAPSVDDGRVAPPYIPADGDER